MRFYISILSFLVVIISCNTKKELSLEEYKSYINDEDNGLTKTQELGDLEYKLTIIPEQLINRNIRKQKKSKLISLRYKISYNKGKDILKTGISSIKDYNMKLMYLTTNIQNDFYLVNGEDTSNCTLLVPEYIDGITPYITCNVSFQLNQSYVRNDLNIVYIDNLFSGEKINFLIKKNDLNNLPKLK